MATARNYGRIRKVDELKALVDKLMRDEKTLGFDIETGYLGPDRKKAALDMDSTDQFTAGFSITNDKRWARYVPVAHDYGDNLPEEKTWEIIKPVLETLPTVAHQMKFEQRNLRLLDVKGRGPAIDIKVKSDTMLEAYALGIYRKVGLKGLVLQEFEHEMMNIESLFPGATQKQLAALRFNILDLRPEVVDYACEDAAWCLALHERNYVKAKAKRQFIFNLEMGISKVLVDMEEIGCAVDWSQLEYHESLGEPFMERMTAAARAGLAEQAQQDLAALNLNSAPQLRKLLYKDLGLKTTRLTDKGKKDASGEGEMEDWERMSTDENALASLAKEHPAIQKVLEVRQVKNVVSRHSKWVTEYRTAHDDRVHASFSQAVVAAGRFSAGEPAIQQVPKRWLFSLELGAAADPEDDWERITGEGTLGRDFWAGNFRDHIVAAPGFTLMGFDYSQIELRMLAGLSQEPALLEAFANKVDVHSVTAAAMLGKTVEGLAKSDRAVGKTMNFALLYGMQAQSLSERLALTRVRADELYAEYFAQFSKVTRWMEEKKREGTQTGAVTTYFGRRVPIWEFESANRGIYSKGERLCVNAPVQGSAADAMKIAMLKVRKALIAAGWWGTKVRLLNNLHDALTFEVSNDLDMEEVRQIIKSAVVFKIAKNFPDIVADWELGYRWGSCAKWEDDQPVVLADGVWQPAPSDGSSATKVIRAEQEEPEESLQMMEEIPVLLAESAPTKVPLAYSINLTKMPTPDQFQRFVSLIKEHPGRNRLTLDTPEGNLELPMLTKLSLHEKPQIQMIFPGSEMQYMELTDA